MGNIGPARQRYEVLSMLAFVADELDRLVLEHAGAEPMDQLRLDAPPPAGLPRSS